MAKIAFPNPIQFLIDGSQPSLFPEVCQSITENYLVIEGCLVPSHGKTKAQSLGGAIQKIYKSTKEETVYLIAGNAGYVLNTLGTLDKTFTLLLSLGDIQIDENLNSELGITTGSAYYVYNYSTHTLTLVPSVDTNGFIIVNPCSIIMIDTIFFIADSKTNTFQASAPNNATDFTTNFANNRFQFTSRPDNIQTLAQSDRTMFVIGFNSVERWVVIGGLQLLNRDNVFLLSYGLYDKKSFADKFNMFAGIFASKDGDTKVQAFRSGQEGFTTISTPGIVKQMLAAGAVVNADLYEIDSHLFYECVFAKGSFIYNFTNNKWTNSTSPFEQVVFFNSINYAAAETHLYQITPYTNDQLKRRITIPAFISPKYDRFNINQCFLWFSNRLLEKGEVFIGAILDGVGRIVIQQPEIDGENYYAVVSREFNIDCFQFALVLETYLNIKWRAFSAEVSSIG